MRRYYTRRIFSNDFKTRPKSVKAIRKCRESSFFFPTLLYRTFAPFYAFTLLRFYIQLRREAENRRRVDITDWRRAREDNIVAKKIFFKFIYNRYVVLLFLSDTRKTAVEMTMDE